MAEFEGCVIRLLKATQISSYNSPGIDHGVVKYIKSGGSIPGVNAIRANIYRLIMCVIRHYRASISAPLNVYDYLIIVFEKYC